MKQIIKHIHLQENPDGTYTETSVEEFEFEIDVPTPEEIIAEKEQKLLDLYEEIQRLKEQNS